MAKGKQCTKMVIEEVPKLHLLTEADSMPTKDSRRRKESGTQKWGTSNF